MTEHVANGVIAYLCHRGEPVSREEILEAFRAWGLNEEEFDLALEVLMCLEGEVLSDSDAEAVESIEARLVDVLEKMAVTMEEVKQGQDALATGLFDQLSYHLAQKQQQSTPSLDDKAPAGADDLPGEVSTEEAANILRVSKDTVLRFKNAGLLEYRNTAPPTSSRPNFAFSLESVLKLRTSYQKDVPVVPQPKEKNRRRVKGDRRYRHLDLD